jgi:hypothetical protein
MFARGNVAMRLACRSAQILVGSALVLLGWSSSAVLGSAGVSRVRAAGGEYVYWANDTYNTIERSNLNGTRVDPTFIAGADSPFGVAVSNQYVYWTDASGIGRANLDGGHVNDKFITIPSKDQAGALALNSAHIYWTEPSQNRIVRADLDGTHIDTSFLTAAAGVANPQGLAATYSDIYWTDSSGTIERATSDGKTVWQKFITGGSGPGALVNGATPLAVNTGYLFWINAGDEIARADLNGTNINWNLDEYVGLGDLPKGIAVTSQYIYWTDPGNHEIGRCDAPNGGDLNYGFFSPAQNPGEIAVSLNATIPPFASPVPVRTPAPLPITPGKTVPKTTTTSTTTTTPIASGATTTVNVTAGAPSAYAFTMSTSTQPKVVSDTPGVAELNVPPGAVVFDVNNPTSGIVSHTFEVCTTPLTKPVTTLPQVQALPDSCSGDVTPLLTPGGTATLKVTLTTPGAYEYLSTANNPDGDAFSGMKGVLNIT